MASNILKTFDFVLRSLFPSFFFKPQGLVSLNQANCNWENNGNVCLKSANKEIAVREPFLKTFDFVVYSLPFFSNHKTLYEVNSNWENDGNWNEFDVS